MQNGAEEASEEKQRHKSPTLMALELSGMAPGEQSEPGAQATSSSDLSSNHSFSKAIIAVIQLVFASLTIYQSQGDQIDHYGYAAFGLTVAPYLMMSLVNLIGAFLTPDYSHIYLVSSDIMEEAKSHGGYFDGVVGTLSPNPTPEDTIQHEETGTCLHVKFLVGEGGLAMQPLTERGKLFASELLGRSSSEGTYHCLTHCLKEDEKIDHRTSQQREVNPRNLNIVFYGTSRKPKDKASSRHGKIGFVSFLVGSLPLALIGGLTLFKHGQSSIAERAWTMTWMASGVVIGLSQHILETQNNFERAEDGGAQVSLSLKYGQIPLGAPAIGGFVVVGKMLLHYGNCVKLF
jgi:hypothetical protein